jgi:hypothetical protein
MTMLPYPAQGAALGLLTGIDQWISKKMESFDSLLFKCEVERCEVERPSTL